MESFWLLFSVGLKDFLTFLHKFKVRITQVRWFQSLITALSSTEFSFIEAQLREFTKYPLTVITSEFNILFSLIILLYSCFHHSIKSFWEHTRLFWLHVKIISRYQANAVTDWTGLLSSSSFIFKKCVFNLVQKYFTVFTGQWNQPTLLRRQWRHVKMVAC